MISKFLAGVAVVVTIISCIAQQPLSARGQTNTDITSKTLESVHYEVSNTLLALTKLSVEFGVPTGLEVSPDDEILKDRKIVVAIDHGTVKDALDSIISQNPLYSWEENYNVINVFPKARREPLLQAFLETEIHSFSMEKPIARSYFRTVLTETPELKRMFNTFGAGPDLQIFTSGELSRLGRDYGIHVSGMTVKSILNRVASESETKSWEINVTDDQPKLLRLNLW